MVHDYFTYLSLESVWLGFTTLGGGIGHGFLQGLKLSLDIIAVPSIAHSSYSLEGANKKNAKDKKQIYTTVRLAGGQKLQNSLYTNRGI